MITKITYKGNWRNINPDNPPKDMRELESFLIFNSSTRNIVKASQGYYKVQNGRFIFLCKYLYQLSLKEFLEKSLNYIYKPIIL